MKTLLILGNGFDINCGLATRYQNFFDDECLNNESYKNFISCIDYIVKLYYDSKIKVQDDITKVIKKYKILICNNLTIWDILFILSNRFVKPIEKWKDVEELIYNTLSEMTRHGFWLRLYDNVKNDYYIDINTGIKKYFLGAIKVLDFNTVIYCVISSLPYDQQDILINEMQLFNQINTFENRFSKYIEKQLTLNKSFFQKNAIETIEQLTNNKPKENVAIDTFNYSYIDESPYKINNIHGCVKPEAKIIFGISDKNVIEKYKFFTKIKRKEELAVEGVKTDANKHEHFDKIVVFGHSLCRQDYYYFFIILSTVFTSSENASKIVFASSSKNTDPNAGINYTIEIDNLLDSYFENISKKKVTITEAEDLNLISFIRI